jgi:polyhydroxybutyrate depolymerase
MRFVIWSVLLFASACGILGDGTGAKLQLCGLHLGGEHRAFLLYVPARPTDLPRPLVLVLHRRGGSAAQAARDYGMNALADAEGFVVAYPETRSPSGWSAGGLPGGDAAADLAFLVQVVNTLAEALPIDADRVYCCGHGSGGIMTYDLAAHVPERLAAIGVVAGSIGARTPQPRTVPAGPPVSVVHIHGTGDDQVPFDSDHATGSTVDRFVSAPDSVAAWAARNGCAPSNTLLIGGQHRIERHATGTGGSEVLLHTLVGAPHAWPTEMPLLGSASFDAAAVLWKFFADHPRRR